MGQSGSVGFSCGNLHVCASEHLCASEDGQGALPLSLPSRCTGSTTIGPIQGKISKAYQLDLSGTNWLYGSSSFGTTLRASPITEGVASRGTIASQEIRAIRAIPKKRCDREKLLREVEVLRRLDHPNLTRFLEVIEDSRVLWLVVELCPGQVLLTAVAGLDPQFITEWLIGQLLRQLLLGLQHLHAAGLTHEDVHPWNILAVGGANGQELRIKLIDYGLAAKYSKNPPPGALRCGNCLAPEQVSGSLSPRTLLSEPSCDLWAVGVIAFILLSGAWPFEAENLQLLRKKIRTGLWAFIPKQNWGVSERAKSFISSLLVVETAKRPSATEALDHAFLRLDVMDKGSVQPLRRSHAIIKSLQRLNGQSLLKNCVVHALATHLQAARLVEFRRHLATLSRSDKSVALTWTQLRLALVQAGVVLPGRLLGPLASVTEDSDSNYESRDVFGEELTDAAAEQRKGLEEVLLWAAWSAATPEGISTMPREDLPKVFEQGSLALRQVLGLGAAGSGSKGGLSEAQLPDLVSFEDFLAILRASASGTNANAGKRSSAAAAWLRPTGWKPSAADLALRMPPPPDGM